jgi:hypothetical protein
MSSLLWVIVHQFSAKGRRAFVPLVEQLDLDEAVI